MQKENKKKILGTVPKKLQFIETFWDCPEFSKKELKNSKGITLIALIITIIIMLILVGASVTVALNGGLFNTAKDAQAKTQEERNKELVLDGGQVEIDGEIYNSIEDYINKNQLANTKCKQIGDLLYVGNESTKTATVYGNRENMDYTNPMWQMYLLVNNLQVTATEISILPELKIDGETYTVTAIANNAFCTMMNQVGATSITTVIIPDTVISIGGNAFCNCTSLENIIIPDSVTNIGVDAFTGTPWLVNNTINGLFIRNNILLDGKGATGDISIPSNVESIAYKAFSNNTGITSITIPDSVISIGTYAFSDCTELTSITLPYNLEIIENYTFENCSSLTSIEIPRNVTAIYGYAFGNCTALTDVEILNTSTDIAREAFYGTPWQANNTINGLFIINNILLDGQGATGDISIPSGVVSINEQAFSYNISITSVTIPDSVTTIESSAFTGCTSLTSVIIPDSVTRIGANAFSTTPWLEEQKSIATNGLVIINNMLIDASGATGDVIIPDTVTVISLFNGRGATSVVIPNSVTRIDDMAFLGTTLTSITIPESVINIGSSVFGMSMSLTEIRVYWEEGNKPQGWDENWNGTSATIVYSYTGE